MKRIIICDDNEKTILQLRNMINRLFPGEFIINGYVSVRQLIYEVEDGFIETPQILFLSLEMKETDGIVPMVKLKEKMSAARIIFMTDCPKRAEEIFDEVNPAGLLFHPLNERRLEKYIRRELENKKEQDEFVKISKQGRQCHISADEIFYVESRGRKLLIHREKETEYVYERISNFCTLYQGNFIRCHQSYAINRRYISEISAKGILLKNGIIVPVSRRKYQEIKENMSFSDRISPKYDMECKV